MEKQRLDILLVERGLAPSCDEAKRLILAGRARVNDQPATKPGQSHPDDARIEIVGSTCPYVGRGGLKLRKALDHFAIDPTGAVCLDVGASTGGFTDCLLQAGATKVYAVDVGRAQLAWKLRIDARVIVLEKTNTRYLNDSHIPERVDLVVIDVSFISVAKILGPVTSRLKPGGRLVVLAKPQFEVGPSQVGKGGVVRDERLHQQVVRDLSSAIESHGLTVDGVIESPIAGADGNREFLIAARAAQPTASP